MTSLSDLQPPSNWTMSRGVLRLVAILLGLVALTAFALGILGAPQRARLPGERAASGSDTTAPLDAVEATPLSQERIEGPPAPPELTPEEKAKLEADKKAKEEAAAAKAEADAAARAAATPVPPPAVTPAPLAVAPAQPAPPTPEEPPF